MSVLKKYFDKSINQASVVKVDYERQVNYDEDGIEYVTYKEVDYPAIQASLGDASNWSLSALLKAGINPNFPIHTGINTRLEGIDVVNKASAMADEILAEVGKEDNKE